MRVTVFKTLFAAFIPRAGAYLGFFKGGGGGHTMSCPGYLSDWYVNIYAMLY